MLVEPGGDWWSNGSHICPVCRDDRKSEALVVCNRCEFGFHPSCHIPQFQYRNGVGGWQCGKCVDVVPSCKNVKQICSQILLKLFSFSKSRQFVTGGSDATPEVPSNLTRIREVLLTTERYASAQAFQHDVYQMFEYHRRNFDLKFVEKLGIRSTLQSKIDSHMEFFRFLVNVHFFRSNLQTNNQGRKKLKSEDSSAPFICDDCGGAFQTRWNLHRHIADVHQLLRSAHHRKVNCARCQRQFGRKQQLVRHLEVDHKAFHVCKWCRTSFAEEYRLRHHLNIFHPTANDSNNNAKLNSF